MKKFLNKRRLKIIGIVFGALVLVYFALFSPQLIDAFRAEFRAKKAEKNYEKWEESIKEQYRNDTYGRDTPEETWSMFIDALEKRDFDLASKYFVLDEQEKQKDELIEIVEDGWMEVFISELKTLEKNKGENISTDREYYFIDYFDEELNRKLSSPVVFFFNPYSKVWKILGL